MRHREKSRTNSDDPKSKEVLAAVGTTAKHKEDNITTVIPKRLILSFATLWSKIYTRRRLSKIMQLLLLIVT